MNELAKMTADELAVKVQEKERRQQYMQTTEGRKSAQKMMLELFEYLKISGYKMPDADPRRMAEVWAEQMSRYIVLYGRPVIMQAAKNFVAADQREYRQVPNATQIIAEAKKIGYNPDVEYARRKHEEEVERMVQEQHERTRRELTPEIKRRFMEQNPTVADVIGGIINDVSKG